MKLNPNSSSLFNPVTLAIKFIVFVPIIAGWLSPTLLWWWIGIVHLYAGTAIFMAILGMAMPYVVGYIKKTGGKYATRIFYNTLLKIKHQTRKRTVFDALVVSILMVAAGCTIHAGIVIVCLGIRLFAGRYLDVIRDEIQDTYSGLRTLSDDEAVIEKMNFTPFGFHITGGSKFKDTEFADTFSTYAEVCAAAGRAVNVQDFTNSIRANYPDAVYYNL